MPGLTLESLRAISTQANRELANAQRKLGDGATVETLIRAGLKELSQ